MKNSTTILLDSIRAELGKIPEPEKKQYPGAEVLLGWFHDRKKAIRDPIYDQIKLNELERAVLRTAEFQRLRWIKQMDFAYLVYPAAEHSRFIHSLGVCQAAKELFDTVVANYREQLFSKTISLAGESERRGIPNFSHFDRVVVSLAGLLHDICHPPFSHAFDMRDDMLEHDDYARNPFLLKALFDSSSSELARVLKRWDRFFQILVRAEAPQIFSPRGQVTEGTQVAVPSLAVLVIELLSIKATDDSGEHFLCTCPNSAQDNIAADELPTVAGSGWNSSPLTFSKVRVRTSSLFRRLHCDIVANTISADLMDYIRRDTRVAGLPRDLDRRFYSYISCGKYRKKDRVVVELEDRQGHVRRDVLSDLMNCMEIRYIIHERIVLHRAVVSARAMAARLRPPRADVDSNTWTLVEEIYGPWGSWYSDAEVLGSVGGVNADLAQLIRNRRLYRPIVILDVERTRRHNITLPDDARERLGETFGAQRDKSKPAAENPESLWPRLIALEEKVNAEVLSDVDAATRKIIEAATGKAPLSFSVCMKPEVLFKNPRILVSVPTSLAKDTAVQVGQIEALEEWLSQTIPLSSHEADQGIYAQIQALHMRYSELWRLYIYAHPALFDSAVGQYVLSQLKLRWEDEILSVSALPAMPPNIRPGELRSQDVTDLSDTSQIADILCTARKVFPKLSLTAANDVLLTRRVPIEDANKRIKALARNEARVAGMAAKGGTGGTTEAEQLRLFTASIASELAGKTATEESTTSSAKVTSDEKKGIEVAPTEGTPASDAEKQPSVEEAAAPNLADSESLKDARGESGHDAGRDPGNLF